MLVFLERSDLYRKLENNELNNFSGKVLSDNNRIFNYRLSRARRNVECAFGILSNKRRILHKAINVNVDLSILLIKTCCALHHFVRSRDGFKSEDAMSIKGLIEMGQDTSGSSRAAMP